VSEFRYYLTGLSAESRFMQAIADDTPPASDEQARGAMADL
jgi:hypothetical protein